MLDIAEVESHPKTDIVAGLAKDSTDANTVDATFLETRRPGCIPRIIHQTYKTSDVPEQWKECHAKWTAFCKAYGWEYMFWTDEDNRKLVEDHYPWFLEKYDAYPHGIQRADVVRSFILHKYGGVYADLDTAPVPAKFEHMMRMYEESDVIIPCTSANNQVGSQNLTNSIMMSQPLCSFWEEVWKYYDCPHRLHGWKRIVMSFGHYFTILMSTGPGTVSDAARTWQPRKRSELRAPEDANKVNVVVDAEKEEIQEKGSDGATTKSDADDRFEYLMVLPSNLMVASEDNPHAAVFEHVDGCSWHSSDAKFWMSMNKVGKNMGWIHLAVTLVLLVTTFVLLYMYVWST